MAMPKGKHAATVRVGERGQVVIPKPIRDLFGIEPGDTLLMLADVERGIAIVRGEDLQQFADQVMRAQPPDAEPGT